MNACPHCPGALARHQETGAVIICDCGTVHAPEGWRWPSETATATATPAAAPSATWTAGPRATTPEVRQAEDPEEVRVRRLLCELRPDRTGPLGWGPYDTPPREEAQRPLPPVRVQCGVSIPTPGLSSGFSRSEPCAAVTDRLVSLGFWDRSSAEILQWLRVNGSLSRGLVALYRAVGEAFPPSPPPESWRGSPAARREGVTGYGRRGVARAAAVWSGEITFELCAACGGDGCVGCRGRGCVERHQQEALCPKPNESALSARR